MSAKALAYDYENFGKLPSDIYQKQNAEEIETLISQSRQLRKDLANYRNIASFTAEDEYWAHEYEKLMADPTNKDYLDLASKL
jgi:hypothetical protein